VEQPQPAMIVANWQGPPAEMEFIPVQFNPKELSFRKSNQLAEINIPGLDSPLLQFVRGQNETLNLELFFDSTDQGMGSNATSVTVQSDRIYELMKIEPGRHAPPVCEFIWNDKFPGGDLSSHVGNQRRNGFKCLVEKVDQKFTLFSPEGVPLRVTLTVTLREYKTLDEQLVQLNLNSPDRTQAHVIQRGETLSAIAATHYQRAGEWRRVAEENGVEDPRRIEPGRFLTVPPIE